MNWMGHGIKVRVLQEGGLLPGPQRGSCLTLGNKLSKETHVLTKQEIYREGAPRRRAVGFVLTQDSSWWCTHCSAKMDATENYPWRWLDTWCLLLTFPELFRLVVTYQLLTRTRTSCHKITHTNGYYGAWPGWAVSVSFVHFKYVWFYITYTANIYKMIFKEHGYH